MNTALKDRAAEPTTADLGPLGNSVHHTKRRRSTWTRATSNRYSERGEIDNQIAAMRNRIIEELRAERRTGAQWGLFTQAADGREEYRPRLSRMAAFHEAIQVTTDWYRDQYMRIEHEVTARWGIDA